MSNHCLCFPGRFLSTDQEARCGLELKNACSIIVGIGSGITDLAPKKEVTSYFEYVNPSILQCSQKHVLQDVVDKIWEDIGFIVLYETECVDTVQASARSYITGDGPTAVIWKAELSQVYCLPIGN